jgi:hypothetical protein
VTDFDEIFSELFGADGDEDDDTDEPGTPDFRGVVSAGRLHLNPWTPWLADSGPFGQMLLDREDAAVVIVDLAITGANRDELVVRFRTEPASRAESEVLLLEWARAVGYRRVWLPDRLVPIDAPAPMGRASVRCPTCGARWRERDASFWHEVRTSGHFPWVCPICAGDLPQWEVLKPSKQTRLAQCEEGTERTRPAEGPWSQQAQGGKRTADRRAK